MKVIYYLKASYSYLLKRKSRTFLAILGIIIGISSVVTIIMLGSILDSLVISEFEKIGIKRVYITTDSSKELREQDFLDMSDEILIKKRFEDSIIALSRVYLQSTYIDIKDDTNINLMIYGVNNNYNKIQQIQMLQGRYLIENDLALKRKVLVIDNRFANKYFGNENVVGETITLDTNGIPTRFFVIGVYKKEDDFLNQLVGANNYSIAYSPNTTLEYLNNKDDRVYGIDMTIKDNVDSDEFVKNVIYYIESIHSNNGEDLYLAQNAEKSLSVAHNIGNMITLVIGIIAAISLLVGGIGIMNIMLVTVSERTSEIGIRKAIGAKNKDILLQFLLESSIITGIGGIIGITIGLLSGYMIGLYLKVDIVLPVVSTIYILLFSILVGTVFGVWPALKATSLSPVEALRRL
ncbi:ABC transporter permease [Petrocella sp. FN5]|uniref:ABC transporter permease n=1 Tax=Petrocella sp. FN5 TaxID=3032002 RepID=UPI0023DAE71F|nr:ABC transporter permease [Petrocella sp. FN5]MDF1617274.1 ABC transporter permease [Petrocella sp. FN5]